MKRKKEQGPIKVLAALSMETKAARAMATGILRFAATHREYEVVVACRSILPQGTASLGGWKPDGLINGPLGGWKSEKRIHARAEVFFQDISGQKLPEGVACGTVLCDNAAAGRIAAAHLIRRNMRHFGFVGERRVSDWVEMRERAFAEELASSGHEAPASFYAGAEATLPEEEEALARWLLALPKPCGIFASSDWRGKRVLDICRAARIDVPGLVQVVGVDNEEYVCEQCLPTLTSIEPDFECGGYEAMALMGDLLSGRRVAERTRIYGMRGIVERQSTRDDRGTARIVNLALDFIRLHGASGGTAADAVKAAGCSASLLQRHFRKVLGRTVVQEIQRVRLEKACLNVLIKINMSCIKTENTFRLNFYWRIATSITMILRKQFLN